jgi:hypothetical protein
MFNGVDRSQHHQTKEGLINSKFQTAIRLIPSVFCGGLLKL